MTEPSLPSTQSDPQRPLDYGSPVLVAILNDPADLARARDDHWYRIRLNAPARHLAADYIAFYQTGAFPPDQRWAVQYYAPVRGYYIVTRRELLPEQPDHPRAGDLYYRVDLGPLIRLPLPIPSRRFRRLTFIHTTLDRLLRAAEINDLWLKTPAQQRLWDLLREAEIEAEVDYPLTDDVSDASGGPGAGEETWGEPAPVADMALFCRECRVAILFPESGRRSVIAEPLDLAYLLARGSWRPVTLTAAELELDPQGCAERIVALVKQLGGIEERVYAS